MTEFENTAHGSKLPAAENDCNVTEVWSHGSECNRYNPRNQSPAEPIALQMNPISWTRNIALPCSRNPYICAGLHCTLQEICNVATFGGSWTRSPGWESHVAERRLTGHPAIRDMAPPLWYYLGNVSLMSSYHEISLGCWSGFVGFPDRLSDWSCTPAALWHGSAL